MPPGFNMNDRSRGRDARMMGAGIGDLKGAKSVWRLFSLIFKRYKLALLVVAACIVASTLATLASTLFTKGISSSNARNTVISFFIVCFPPIRSSYSS